MLLGSDNAGICLDVSKLINTDKCYLLVLKMNYVESVIFNDCLVILITNGLAVHSFIAVSFSFPMTDISLTFPFCLIFALYSA